MLGKKKEEIDTEKIEWDSKELKSRNIQRVLKHEMCEFRYIHTFEDIQLSIIEGKKVQNKKKRGDDTIDHEHDEYSFDDDEMDYSIRDEEDEHFDYEEDEYNHDGT